jgi:hypothetical protein
MIQDLGLNQCFRCQQPMTLMDYSIEHKKEWLGDDSNLFWDISNIAFSHKKCNLRRSYLEAASNKRLKSDVCRECGVSEQEAEFAPKERFCVSCFKKVKALRWQAYKGKRKKKTKTNKATHPGTADTSTLTRSESPEDSFTNAGSV